MMNLARGRTMSSAVTATVEDDAGAGGTGGRGRCRLWFSSSGSLAKRFLLTVKNDHLKNRYVIMPPIVKISDF
jgi:hypothetical protein